MTSSLDLSDEEWAGIVELQLLNGVDAALVAGVSRQTILAWHRRRLLPAVAWSERMRAPLFLRRDVRGVVRPPPAGWNPMGRNSPPEVPPPEPPSRIYRVRP